jgi:aminoglycoside phosphotransferase (APT) family kinase protein
VPTRMHDDEVDVGSALVARLLEQQMPDLAGLELVVVEPWGTDNAIWRLGTDLVVRLPRIHGAVDEVEQQATWLPRLAGVVPVAVPEPIAVGRPGFGYPFPWAVHRWIPGEAAARHRIGDPIAFALELAEVVRALWLAPTTAGPPARGRARPLHEYDRAARAAIDGARHLVDAPVATAVWEEALAAPAHDDPAVWVHGDLEGNCIVRDGHLSGLVDWGSACVGDPAVDVQVVWSPLFTPRSRAAFLEAAGVDDAMLARSRGAAVHQACAALPYYLRTYPLIVERSVHKLRQLGIPTRSPGPGGTSDRAL